MGGVPLPPATLKGNSGNPKGDGDNFSREDSAGEVGFSGDDLINYFFKHKLECGNLERLPLPRPGGYVAKTQRHRHPQLK